MDYESEEFYTAVTRMARSGMTDKEIANSLGLDPAHFSKVKNGKVSGVSEEVNKRHSERLRHALASGRVTITGVLRATYLNVALGKVFTKQTVRKKQEAPCACGGKDPNCPECGGAGVIITDIGIIQENEVQQPPSTQAIMNLLNIYDPDWRGGIADEADMAERGIDIRRWIEQETAARDKAKEGGDDTDA